VAKKRVQKPVTPPAMTKKQLSRWQKQKRQERLALAFVVGVVALVVLVLGFGYYQENVAKPNAPIARINGTPISANTWVKAMVLQSRNLDQQLTYWENQRLSMSSADPDTQAYLQSLIDQQEQQLTQAKQQLIFTVPDDLMAAELIRQEAQKRGLVVTPEEVQAALVEIFQPPAQQPVTDTASTTPTPTPIPANAWQQNYKDFLASLKISEAEYQELVLLPGLQRDKLQRALSETVPASGEQIRISHIVTDTEEAAKGILQRVQAGEDFAALAKELSSDSATTEIGGDLGWYPRGILTTEYGKAFEDAAWSLQKGQVVTAPVQTYFGYHIIKQTDRDANRPYDADKLSQLQENALNDWLDIQLASPAVERFQDSDKLFWVQDQVSKALQPKK